MRSIKFFHLPPITVCTLSGSAWFKARQALHLEHCEICGDAQPCMQGVLWSNEGKGKTRSLGLRLSRTKTNPASIWRFEIGNTIQKRDRRLTEIGQSPWLNAVSSFIS